MRILFSGAPAGGHLYPMLPLVRAAADAGDEVLIFTGRTGGHVAPDWRVIEHGHSMDELLSEAKTRMAGDDGTDPGAGSIELFGGVRLEGAATDSGIAAARSFSPDLIVAEAFDQVGPFLAGVLGVPHVTHALTGPVPPGMMAAIAARADAVFRRHGVARASRIALIDPFPDVLISAEERQVDGDRLPIRPAVHSENLPQPTLPAENAGRPRVLVSLGTAVADRDALQGLVAAALDAGADAIVTAPRGIEMPEFHRPHVTWVGFSPLNNLLSHVDAVVSAGGTGTSLAALAEGLPLVIRPFLADQPWNAKRLQDREVAVVVDGQQDAAVAIRRVLTDPRYRANAQALQRTIAELPSAAEVLERVRLLV